MRVLAAVSSTAIVGHTITGCNIATSFRAGAVW